MRATNKIMAVFAALALLFALGVTASLWSVRDIEDAARSQQHSQLAIRSANDLLSILEDADSGQRDYSLTGDQAFLEAYPALRERISGQLERLRQLDVAGLANTGNRLIVDIENGKPTVQLQKVLDLLDILGLELVIQAKTSGML